MSTVNPPTTPCRAATCAATVFFAEDRHGRRKAFDSRPFLQPDVPRENAWLIRAGVKGKLVATHDGAPESVSVYVAHHLTCPGTDVRDVKSVALRRRRDEYRRSALHE